MYADSHCHLTMLDNPDAAVRQAREAGVSTMLTICTNFTEEADDIVDFSVAHEGVWCALGTHPHAADTDCTDSGTLLQRLLSTPKAVAVGETGLDFYYKNSNKESQKISFAKHIEASLKASLPLVIHSRAAEEDTLSLLQSDTWRDTPRGVMHCFTGSADLARATLDLGLYIAFSGIITFKNAQALRDIAAWVPEDRLLIETDSPYLAPVPHRGERNEPAFIRHTAQCLADIRGESVEALAQATRANFFALFTKARDYLS